MKFDEFLEKETKARKIENRKRLFIDANNKSKDLMFKIDQYLKSNESLYSKEEILDEIKNGNEFACVLFEKDLRRQGIEEEVQFCYFDENKIDVVKLPKAGKDSLFICESGEVLKNKEAKKYQLPERGKSIDGFCEIGNKKIYLTCKYTKSNGGAQDNQRDDGINFLLRGMKCEDNNSFFVFICDGEYYNNGERNRVRKIIEKINEENKNLFVFSIEEFIEFLKRFNNE